MARAQVGLKDVAALAEVSVKTVSNVVNESPHVAEPTRARVLNAIAQLGYRPNLAARNLRGGRSGLVGLALPQLDIPYFAELASRIVEAAAAHDVTVLVEQTGGSREREQRFMSGLQRQLVDGLILMPLGLAHADLAARQDPVPLVLLGELVEGEAIDEVGIDNARAGAAATDHLVALGRRRIAMIGVPREPVRSTTHIRRLRGFRQALEDAEIEPEDALMPEIRALNPIEGDRAMAQLLALPEPPDAVFCFNDLLAIGAVRRLLTSGRRVPEDVAVVGFDDIQEARYLTPTLTTIAPDKDEIARAAVRRVLARIEDPTTDRRSRVEVPFTLVERESTLGRSGDDAGPQTA